MELIRYVWECDVGLRCLFYFYGVLLHTLLSRDSHCEAREESVRSRMVVHGICTEA